eukprot:TRINITY_DN11696_c0_g1_i1.p1 TRINITY_DN11696_c0_g1~~TRINITY_DN11696_c0_g1_i1.p1  ORF type:complete len:928 (-),score=140.79 TRINITY_DN11696_c0_g1_i1:394-2985(-)
MVADTTANGKKCGAWRSADRVFDLRSGSATRENCDAECLKLPNCVAYSGQFGSWCVGCKQALTTAAAGTTAYKKQVPATAMTTATATTTTTTYTIEALQPAMVADTTANGKKCGAWRSADRVFDLRSGSATRENCDAECLKIPGCVAYSGQFGSWCVGCKQALTTAAAGTTAYKKQVPATAMTTTMTTTTTITTTTITTTTTTTTSTTVKFTKRVVFGGDYDAEVGDRKLDFLQECIDALYPAWCQDVEPNNESVVQLQLQRIKSKVKALRATDSMVVTVAADSPADLDTALGVLNSIGLQLPSFGELQELQEVQKTAPCEDTPGWSNWAGWDCSAYMDYCADGMAVPGHEWFFGDFLGNPEQNCCACGKDQKRTCSTYPCPVSYTGNRDNIASTDVSDSTCCIPTCGAHTCPAGERIISDRWYSTVVSNDNCCETTTTTTTTSYAGPGKARYVRILPQSWHSSMTTRAAVLVGADLVVQDPREEDRSYSSVKPLNNRYKKEGDEGYPGSGYGCSRVGQSVSRGWTAKYSRQGEWLQIDLGVDMDVRGVLIVGKPKTGCPHLAPHYVKSVKVQTATAEDPTVFTHRDNGKVWNTESSADKGEVRIVFEVLEGGAPTTTSTFPVQGSGMSVSKVDDICPDQLWTNKIVCDDGSVIQEGECCPDTASCPSDCSSSQMSYTSDFKPTCTCHGCRKQRSLAMSNSEAFLKAHNYLRCLHGYSELQWDPAIASNAEIPANQSCLSGALVHSDSYAMTPKAGENLARGHGTPEAATLAWYNEVVDPGYTLGTAGDQVLQDGAGHYTALIWKETSKLGCASCTSDGKKIWACQYADEAPNSGIAADWLQNVPQTNVLEATPMHCCAQIYR